MYLQADPAKPSEGLEYTFARKSSGLSHEQKVLAHIWEVGGTSKFAEAVTQTEQLFLNYKQVGSKRLLKES